MCIITKEPIQMKKCESILLSSKNVAFFITSHLLAFTRVLSIMGPLCFSHMSSLLHVHKSSLTCNCHQLYKRLCKIKFPDLSQKHLDKIIFIISNHNISPHRDFSISSFLFSFLLSFPFEVDISIIIICNH